MKNLPTFVAKSLLIYNNASTTYCPQTNYTIYCHELMISFYYNYNMACNKKKIVSIMNNIMMLGKWILLQELDA